VVTAKADPSIQRITRGNFQFPLGAYPVEDLTPRQGYSVHFEPADGDEVGEEGVGGEGGSGEWEEWPDRYVFDVVISAERVEPLCRMLFSLLSGRVYPILDVLGHDAFREIDPYISYDLVGLDRFTDAVRRFRDFLYEDGMCGFGAMCEEPFFYIFIDEHKIITIRAEPGLKDKVEKILSAFDLEAIEEPAGADAAAHEHRGVLSVPSDNPELLSQEEIVERLKEEWQLLLNVDPDTNVDDEGKEVGKTSWRVIVRCEYEEKAPKYAEVLMDAENLRQAEELAFEAVDELSGGGMGGLGGMGAGAGIEPPGALKAKSGATESSGEGSDEEATWEDAVIVAADRVKPEVMKELLAQAAKEVTGKGGEPGRARAPDMAGVRSARWVQ
jgi:hypothetical protein